MLYYIVIKFLYKPQEFIRVLLPRFHGTKLESKFWIKWTELDDCRQCLGYLSITDGDVSDITTASHTNMAAKIGSIVI